MKTPLIAIEIVTDTKHQHLLGIGAAEILENASGIPTLGMSWGDWAGRPLGAVAPACYPPGGSELTARQLWTRLGGFLLICGWEPSRVGWGMVSSEGWDDWSWLVDRYQLTGVVSTPIECERIGAVFADDDEFPNPEMLARRAARKWIKIVRGLERAA